MFASWRTKTLQDIYLVQNALFYLFLDGPKFSSYLFLHSPKYFKLYVSRVSKNPSLHTVGQIVLTVWNTSSCILLHGPKLFKQYTYWRSKILPSVYFLTVHNYFFKLNTWRPSIFQAAYFLTVQRPSNHTLPDGPKYFKLYFSPQSQSLQSILAYFLLVRNISGCLYITTAQTTSSLVVQNVLQLNKIFRHSKL